MSITHIYIPTALLTLSITSATELVILALAVSFNGKGLVMSNSQLATLTGASRRAVIYSVGRLESRGYIKIVRGVNDKKIIVSDQVFTLTSSAESSPLDNQSGATSSPEVVQLLHPSGATNAQSGATSSHITKVTKENLKKTKVFHPNSDEFRLSEILLTLILARKPDFKKPNLQAWAKHIDRMIRLDNRKPETIGKVIRWAQADDFWQNNILSAEKLRKQFDTLELKSQGKQDHGNHRRDFSKQESSIGTTIKV